MERIFLYVAPEEYAEVEALGARFEDDTKQWYIDGGLAPASFSRCLKDDPEEEEFGLSSEEARVASAMVRCAQCRKPIEGICIYCDMRILGRTFITITARIAGPFSSTIGSIQNRVTRFSDFPHRDPETLNSRLWWQEFG